MYRQVARYKGKRQDRIHEVAVDELDLDEATEETLGEIVRVKRFEVLPMAPEEAIEQMELLGHSFYIFLNVDEDAINVLYKRGDGNYGLLQPELA
jgi:putative sigma-54 modulation protein